LTLRKAKIDQLLAKELPVEIADCRRAFAKGKAEEIPETGDRVTR
jgi:hypothetical protein